SGAGRGGGGGGGDGERFSDCNGRLTYLLDRLEARLLRSGPAPKKAAKAPPPVLHLYDMEEPVEMPENDTAEQVILNCLCHLHYLSSDEALWEADAAALPALPDLPDLEILVENLPWMLLSVTLQMYPEVKFVHACLQKLTRNLTLKPFKLQVDSPMTRSEEDDSDNNMVK
ncbi:unnamed protein product, partial [Symbiodinium sp. KB8]